MDSDFRRNDVVARSTGRCRSTTRWEPIESRFGAAVNEGSVVGGIVAVFLRWHYPDQVVRVGRVASALSARLTELPSSFASVHTT